MIKKIQKRIRKDKWRHGSGSFCLLTAQGERRCSTDAIVIQEKFWFMIKEDFAFLGIVVSLRISNDEIRAHFRLMKVIQPGSSFLLSIYFLGSLG